MQPGVEVLERWASCTPTQCTPTQLMQPGVKVHERRATLKPLIRRAICAQLWLMLGALITHAPLQAAAKKMPALAWGKGEYTYLLSRRDRANGISYYGSAERLRLAVEKMKKGYPVHLVTVGASITAGQGAQHAGLSWPQYLFNWAAGQYGAHVSGVNGAVPGTISSYMSVCHNLHVPKDADIVFVEYSVNDIFPKDPPFVGFRRRAFERLIRKLLQYPNKPAVVLVHSYCWMHPVPFVGSFWSNAEHELSKFGLYYGLPSISLKAAVYQHMVAGDAGFQVNTTVNADPDGLLGFSFYYDRVHPDGWTGARMIAELAMHLIQMADRDIDMLQPIGQEDKEWASKELPAPMLPNNYESPVQKCFIGNDFTEKVVSTIGWKWVNEAAENAASPKWGFVASEIGATLTLSLDTRSQVVASNANKSKVLVEIVYLKSYEKMGKARVSCTYGCECNKLTMNGHQEERNSQLHLFKVYTTQSANCTISLTVSPTTSSGQHKFKIAGVIVREEIGSNVGSISNRAVERVHDESIKSQSGLVAAPDKDRK